MEDNEITLTVAIPTYERAAQLETTLHRLLPQIQRNGTVRLLLLDNASSVPAQQVYESVGIPLPDANLSIVRHPCNLGGGGNLMRCFELVETKWLWVLSDDDDPSPNAIETILSDLEADHSFVYYSVPSIQKPVFESFEGECILGDSFESLLERFDDNIGQLAFISAYVFDVECFRQHFTLGHLLSVTWMSHLMMAMKVLSGDGRWMISRKSIVDYRAASQSDSWGFMGLAWALPAMIDFANTDAELELIVDRIIRGWRPSPKKVLYSLIARQQRDQIQQGRLPQLFRILKTVYAPSWKSDFTLRGRWVIAQVWSYFPRSFKWIYERQKAGRRIDLSSNSRR